MNKTIVRDEIIIPLLKEKQYDEAWKYCQYMGYHWIKDSAIRKHIFMKFVSQFDCEDTNFIMEYVKKIQNYANGIVENEQPKKKTQGYKIKKR